MSDNKKITEETVLDALDQFATMVRGSRWYNENEWSIFMDQISTLHNEVKLQAQRKVMDTDPPTIISERGKQISFYREIARDIIQILVTRKIKLEELDEVLSFVSIVVNESPIIAPCHE
jgi:hypothetical protein